MASILSDRRQKTGHRPGLSSWNHDLLRRCARLALRFFLGPGLRLGLFFLLALALRFGFASGPFLRLAGLLSLACLLRFRFGLFDSIHQLDQRHRCVVAETEAELEYAQISTRTFRIARPELVEELVNNVLVAQAVVREATIRERRLLAERDQRLGDAAQLLRLGERRADHLVREQRVGHVAQHRDAMAARAVE